MVKKHGSTTIATPPFILLLFILLLFSLAKPANAADWLYTIRPGDTLWSLCQQYTKEPNCWNKLGPLNNIDQNRKIPPGTRIRVPAGWLKVPAASAIITFTQGDVTYQHVGENKAPAAKGVKLPAGSILTTGKGSVTLVFADGSSMILEPNSHLELDALSSFESNGMVDSSVRLNRGTLKTRVIKREPRSQFRTITPSAVAAVRGTEYRVNLVSEKGSEEGGEQSDNKSTLIEVYQGLVDVGAENTTHSVPAGFGIVTKQGQAPQAPTRLLDKPLFLPFDENQNLTMTQVDPITIQWQPIDTASGYQLNILTDQKKDAQPEALIQTYRTKEHQVNLNTLAQGCYQLSLRAADPLGLHGLASRKRLCLTEVLAIPIFDGASSNDNSKPDKRISWSEISGAQGYRIEISEHPNFSALIENTEVLESHYLLEHKRFKQNAELFIRVQALSVSSKHSNFSQSIHWKPEKFPEEIVEVAEEKEIWPVLLPIGFFLLALL